MVDAGPVDLMHEARGEAVQLMAHSIKETIAGAVALHGPDDPMINSIVGAALVLVIVDLTAKVDPAMAATVIVQLGGSPFAPAP